MQNPWFNPWFESIAVAQKRAKRRLPKSVYGALIAGAEAGVTKDDNVEAFDELVILDGPELPSLTLWMLAPPDVRRVPRVAVVWDTLLSWAHALR